MTVDIEYSVDVSDAVSCEYRDSHLLTRNLRAQASKFPFGASNRQTLTPENALTVRRALNSGQPGLSEALILALLMADAMHVTICFYWLSRCSEKCDSGCCVIQN